MRRTAPPALLALLALAVALAAPAAARIELVTLPERAGCQLTIYNSADLTLVRDERELTFRKGANRIEFSWENTRIDPTSVQIEPMPGAPAFRVLDTVFPPRVANTLVWNIESDHAGKVPVRISYFTAGIGWQADYGLVLDPEERAAVLEGFVTVNNGSGEEYERSSVRLVVGKINLVESVDRLAGGRGGAPRPAMARSKREMRRDESVMMKMLSMDAQMEAGSAAPKEIVKEGLSEYFIYTVGGRETIPNGWAKRLPSLSVPGLRVESVFRHEDFRLGPDAVRFVSFRNDAAHGMGKEPLPDGRLRVMKVDAAGNLQYLGATDQKYVPVDATVEVNLGVDREVRVETALLDYRTENYSFDHRGNPDGWDTLSTWRIRVRNFKSSPVRLEMKRRFDGKWELKSDRAPFAKEDLRTVKFTRQVAAGVDDEFVYTLRRYHGRNAEGR